MVVGFAVAVITNGLIPLASLLLPPRAPAVGRRRGGPWLPMAGSGASAGRAGSTAGASAAPPPRVRACACASSVGPARVRAPARAPSPPAGGGAPRSAPVCARVSVRVPGTQHVPARRAWEVLLASVPSAAPRRKGNSEAGSEGGGEGRAGGGKAALDLLPLIPSFEA